MEQKKFAMLNKLIGVSVGWDDTFGCMSDYDYGILLGNSINEAEQGDKEFETIINEHISDYQMRHKRRKRKW